MSRETVLFWFYRCVSLLLAVVYFLVIIALFQLGVLPGVYLAVIIIVSAPLIAWLSILVFKPTTSMWKRRLAALASLILSGLSMYLLVSLYATSAFLTGLDTSADSRTAYSVVAKKERHLTLTNAKSAMLIKNDSNGEAVSAEFKKLANITQTSVDSLVVLKTHLANNSADVGVLRNAQLDLIKETDRAFYDTLEVIATFEVRSSLSTLTSTVDADKPFILYISGIDTYGEVASVSRSDVNMLVVVNPREHKVLLVNTPRDYYVQLHGTSGVRDKLTHAGIYGTDMSINTMEDLYGVSIDSYARVNFSSLISIVDTLGGITVQSDYAFKGYRQGLNNLNGVQALEFSRERYSFAEGDRARGKNQQRVIEAIIQKMQSPAVLGQYTSLLSKLRTSLETNVSGNRIAELVNKQLSSLRAWTVESASVDGVGKMAPTYSMGATPLYVMEPDAASVAAVKQRIVQYLAQ